jgi:hypothetical protein
MFATSPILACGSIHLSPEAIMLIWVTFIGWLLSLVLALVNVVWSSAPDASTRFRTINGGILVAYVLLAGALFAGWMGSASVIAIFGIPLMVISHSVYLFIARRHLRQKLHEANEGGHSLNAKGP